MNFNSCAIYMRLINESNMNADSKYIGLFIFAILYIEGYFARGICDDHYLL